MLPPGIYNALRQGRAALCGWALAAAAASGQTPHGTPAPAPSTPAGWTCNGTQIIWPTPNHGFIDGANMSTWIQDTGTGDPHSGLFGCVRDNEHKFHEGIDIKCLQRDKAGEPIDPVYAAMAGKVAYINNVGSNGSYGRYIVLEHNDPEAPVYTLYGHLAAIQPGLKVGQEVYAGQTIAKMGHTAVPAIPKDRAHMHFEVGVRLTNNFEPWYDSKKYGSPNLHGLYNGYNLTAFDELAFFEAVKAGKFHSFSSYIRSLPKAFTLRVTTSQVPDFVQRYPGLLTKPVQKGAVAGWDIDFTWYGLPMQWTPLPAGTAGLGKPGELALVSYVPAEFKDCMCRNTLLFNAAKPTAAPKLGDELRDDIKLLFGFK
jgi:murein DD-endopeptidase MepM/ murein hydrolase activator NlpD